jgi:hypothetical protein
MFDDVTPESLNGLAEVGLIRSRSFDFRSFNDNVEIDKVEAP